VCDRERERERGSKEIENEDEGGIRRGPRTRISKRSQ
jgi:hypothetical protein